MKINTLYRRNKQPHNHGDVEKKESPFFSKEAHTPFFSGNQHSPVQPRLRVGQAGDSYEQEADRVADAVTNQPVSSPGIQQQAISGIQRESLATPLEDEKRGTAEQRMEEDKLVQEKQDTEQQLPEEEEVQKKAVKEEEEEAVQKKELVSPQGHSGGLAGRLHGASGGGAPLSPRTQAFMGSSFGKDFSGVRIHTDRESAALNDDLGALAFTHGKHVYFNTGQYDPNSKGGRHLLAHELTHVVQQSGGSATGKVQREGMGDLRMAEANEQLISDIRAEAAYKALAPDDKKLADEIIEVLNKRKQHERYQILIKLKLLFQTPLKTEAEITAETNVSTSEAVKVEKARVVKPKAVKNLDLEEKASADPKRKWKAIKGKFGGGTYYVDSSSASNIVVKAKIFLKPTGTGTPDNVRDIKKMEDGIEKAASTKGYLVDIQFVNDASDPDTFTVEVNPGKWEVATNWSGGDPVGYAHELHHLFAFEQDRYNYIEAHASNESMEIPTRLYWFRQELNKPAGYNDPTSLMNGAPNPNDSDVCTVAGLDQASCMAERSKIKK